MMPRILAAVREAEEMGETYDEADDRYCRKDLVATIETNGEEGRHD
jgi:hypothetical protein